MRAAPAPLLLFAWPRLSVMPPLLRPLWLSPLLSLLLLYALQLSLLPPRVVWPLLLLPSGFPLLLPLTALVLVFFSPPLWTTLSLLVWLLVSLFLPPAVLLLPP